ncbi:protein SPIRAL1-like 2 [Rhodamnia argentea]|uniref:Protein SPIRAL1-like 2 n=1 Tax=Rhodamnia argentea TaxID=178133 RepID=A0A8B8MV47_9MYRT|nr:protein SPIRAL1-like 2 [Rhodamnia argentea]XP_048139856.1 protein SPIRAL1-like 2 [Rhodamnia argentea]
MGRGVSSGGGQSSLGYLFGSGEPANNNPPKSAKSEGNAESSKPPPPENGPTPAPQAVDGRTPAGTPGNLTNNYFRADGQNCGNFITDRPSTKVHAAPGGGSQLDYLFGNGGN